MRYRDPMDSRAKGAAPLTASLSTASLSTASLLTASLAALLMMVAAAQAFDESKYPDLKGQWERTAAPRWLDAKTAPIGAGRFAYLAGKGTYNGSRWHRIIKGFVIQGGAPGGDLSKNAGNAVVGEVPKGKYALGDIAAAKTGTDPNGTFDSQFFIVTGPQGEALPPQYADFGHVTSGMDVVNKIDGLKTDSSEQPTTKATIDKVTVTSS